MRLDIAYDGTEFAGWAPQAGQRTVAGVIEETLDEAGMKIPEGTVKLPADKMKYSTYASDGTTLTREYYSFDGSGEAENGSTYPWSAVLSYDYTLANTTGNLADTMRTIYIYIGQ